MRGKVRRANRAPATARTISSPIAPAVEDYLDACRARGVRPTTLRDGYGFPLRKMLLPWCEREEITSVEQLDQRALERFANDLRERGGRRGPLSVSSIWTYVKTANQFVAWWREDNGGPSVKVKLRRPPAREVEILSREEIKAIERAAGTERDKLIVRVLADTAMRPGELVGIRGRDLRHDSRRQYVRVEGKGGEREVPLDRDLWRRLRALGGDEDEHVFRSVRRDPRTGMYERLRVHGVEQMVETVTDVASIGKHVTPYTFRHSACRFMLLKGLSTVEVAAIMGHGSERMIAYHYANIGKADVHDRLLRLLREEG